MGSDKELLENSAKVFKGLRHVCGSCGTRCCVVLITECHNSNQHGQRPLITAKDMTILVIVFCTICISLYMEC